MTAGFMTARYRTFRRGLSVLLTLSLLIQQGSFISEACASVVAAPRAAAAHAPAGSAGGASVAAPSGVSMPHFGLRPSGGLTALGSALPSVTRLDPGPMGSQVVQTSLAGDLALPLPSLLSARPGAPLSAAEASLKAGPHSVPAGVSPTPVLTHTRARPAPLGTGRLARRLASLGRGLRGRSPALQGSLRSLFDGARDHASDAPVPGQGVSDWRGWLERNAAVFRTEDWKPSSLDLEEGERRIEDLGQRQGRERASKGFFRVPWETWTRRLTDLATLAFLALQLPQIIKNFGYFAAGDVSPIAILPWMGYATGILGNMLLLSYFVSKKEAGAARVQAVGVISCAVVLAQIYLAGFMPAAAFFTVTPAIVTGLVLNYLNFKGGVNGRVWTFWKRLSGIAGLVVLPLVLFETFLPSASVWAAAAAGLGGLALLVLQKLGRLPEGFGNIWTTLSAWTATFLFMFGPVAQLVNNAANPEIIAGLSLVTVILATLGNALMLPRAMLKRDRIWFTGSFWAVAVGGVGVMLSMLLHGALSPVFFWGVTAALAAYLAYILVISGRHSGDPSVRRTLSFLLGR